MEKGRYTVYAKMRLPKRKRRIAVPGSFEDTGKYIRCWNCGFIINVDRDMGDPERTGNYETDMIVAAQSPVGSGDDIQLGLDTLSMVGVLLIDGPDGNPVTDFYTPRIPQVARGCPLCGCTSL